MIMFILTSISCAKERWWCRNVRCRCRPAELKVEQICSVEAETADEAAAKLGGSTEEYWDREEHWMSTLGQWVKRPFIPGLNTLHILCGTYPVIQGDSFFANKIARDLYAALTDGRRKWQLVHVPQLGKAFCERHAMGHDLSQVAS